jgi:hypothetical protein
MTVQVIGVWNLILEARGSESEQSRKTAHRFDCESP